MDTRTLIFHIINGSAVRRVLFRAFLLASALSIVSLVRVPSNLDLGALAPITYEDCVADSDSANVTLTQGSYLFPSRLLNTVWGSFDSTNCKQDVNLTVAVVTELMGKQLLDCNAKSLCIGEGASMAASAMQQLGFSSVHGVHKHRFFSLKQKKIVYELHFQDSSFDFVFARDLDKVSVPALLVLEVERVLKPGGIGALLVGASRSNPNDLIKSAAPVSSLLRSSSVVHVGHINQLNLVVFKKKSDNSSASNKYRLTADCPNFSLNKPLMQLLETLVEERPPPEFVERISYLPKFVDVSTRKRMVYIDIGVGKPLNSNVTDWFLPSYPIDQKAFNVYFVHYNTSILLSYVKRPGITFIYHPGLAGDVAAKLNIDGEVDPYVGEEEFDFLAWFKETVQFADFVVLKMNAREVELKFLSDLLESGVICFVDEMFLGCPDSEDGKNMEAKKSCMDMYKGLRSSGVYVHQWWGN
ncbi:hypothetical protein QN277_021377 [Acacia crassicarpa]|uniref:Methyltransferase type 11 domain-containing protein n=1 Tax=Acacia crassicarpa TaxID=499986 RepID=A0AAE1JNN8_9FABA|nr:hypothetical protein QN277_021377 [Acacia crassicarpa]